MMRQKNPRHNICVTPHVGKGTLNFNTTRIIRKNPLNAEDIMSCRKFDDAITAGNYDIDIHNPSGSGTYHYVEITIQFPIEV